MSVNTTSNLHTDAVRAMNLARLEAAYVYTTAADPIGALRQQRACSLYMEHRLYDANKTRRAKTTQAAKETTDTAMKAWKALKERDWALTYVLFASPDEESTLAPIATSSSKTTPGYSAAFAELPKKKKKVRFAENLPTPEKAEDDEDEAHRQ